MSLFGNNGGILDGYDQSPGGGLPPPPPNNGPQLDLGINWLLPDNGGVGSPGGGVSQHHYHHHHHHHHDIDGGGLGVGQHQQQQYPTPPPAPGFLSLQQQQRQQQQQQQQQQQPVGGSLFGDMGLGGGSHNQGYMQQENDGEDIDGIDDVLRLQPWLE